MLPGRRRAGSSPFALEAVRCETRQGAKAKETKRDKDLRRRMLHGCEQMRPSLVSILQVSIISPHAHQDARCATVTDMEDGDRLPVYSRTILFLAAGLRPHEAGVAAGELVVELAAHLSSCSTWLLRRICLGWRCRLSLLIK